VQITKIVDDNEVLLALLKPGDIFGEMSLIENKPRSASAIAHEDAVLLAVNKANFQRMVTQQPQIITRLTQLLAERIWFIYKQLANTLLSDPVGRMFDALLIQLEKARVPIAPGGVYTFDFGPKELVNMVGLSNRDGNAAIQQLFKNTKVKVVDNRIHCTDVDEVEKQARYYRNMERRERARKQSSVRI
jgi:CRP-like cAMP-binding protein